MGENYFKPIVVADQCCIHSTFHTDYPQCQYDIVIDPKMAFGTGHHATTSQIIARLLDTDLQGKRVIDMGTGTGILAILARMRGASSVTAIEIDPAAEANARENMQLNGCPTSTCASEAPNARRMLGRPLHRQHQPQHHTQ